MVRNSIPTILNCLTNYTILANNTTSVARVDTGDHFAMKDELFFDSSVTLLVRAAMCCEYHSAYHESISGGT